MAAHIIIKYASDMATSIAFVTIAYTESISIENQRQKASTLCTGGKDHHELEKRYI